MFKNHNVAVKNIIFIIMVLLLLKFLSQITTTVMIFFIAYVFACSLNPLVDKFSEKMSRPLATCVVMGGIGIILVSVFIPLVIVAVQQIEQFVVAMPDQFDTAKDFVLHKQILGKSVLSMINVSSIVAPITNFTQEFFDQFISISLNLASAFIYVLSVCVITYYLLVDRKTLEKAFMLFFPSHLKKKADKIVNSISEKIGNYIVAQLAVITSVGICVMIPLLIMRIDCAVFLGFISAILDLIPIVGPTIAGIICAFMCYHYGPVILGLVIFFFLLAQWIENNFVRPYVFGKFMDLHPLIIFFALFVTAKFLGPIGVVFAPPIAATVAVLIDELYIKPINKEE